jgi:hypothetical protein
MVVYTLVSQWCFRTFLPNYPHNQALTSEIYYEDLQFVANIFARQMQNFNKIKVAMCEIAEKRMTQGSAAWRNSGIEWEEYLCLNVHFMDLQLSLAIFA